MALGLHAALLPVVLAALCLCAAPSRAAVRSAYDARQAVDRAPLDARTVDNFRQWTLLRPNGGNQNLWPAVRSHHGKAEHPAIVNRRFYSFGGTSVQYVPDGTVLSSGEVVHGYKGQPVPITFYLNDVHYYDIDTNAWQSVAAGSGTAPVERSYPSMVFDEARDELVVFGGVANFVFWPTPDTGVYFFNVGTGAWRDYQIPGDAPAGSFPTNRYAHTAVIHEDLMYVFGGYWPIPGPPMNVSGQMIPQMPKFFDDLFVFDLNPAQHAWSRIDAPNGPSGRDGHTAVVHDGGMYVYAGEQYETNPTLVGPRFLSDMWRFDFEEGAWTLIVPANPQDELVDFMVARAHHAATVDPADEFMLVFGGIQHGIWMNDILKYYFETNTWAYVPPYYPACDPRMGHSLFPRSDGDSLHFLVSSGRRFSWDDMNDVGVLYVGDFPDPTEEPGPEIDDGDNTVDFEEKAPNHVFYPEDECGERGDDFYRVTFVELREVNTLGYGYQRINLRKTRYELVESVGDDDSASLTFSLGVAGNQRNVTADFGFTIVRKPTVIDYAGTTITIPKGTNKWSLNVSGWEFFSQLHSLEIELEIASNRRFSQSSIQQDPVNKYTNYVFRAGPVEALFAISSLAIIDDQITEIDHAVSFDPSSNRNPRIFIRFPNFQNTINYDPNFGVVLNSDDSCGDDDTVQAVIISLAVIIPVLFCVGVVAVGVYYYVRYKRVKPVTKLEMVDFDTADVSSDGSEGL